MFVLTTVGTTCFNLSIIMAILTMFAPYQPLLLSSLLCHDGNFLVNISIHYGRIIRTLFATSEFLLLANATLNSVHYCFGVLLKGVAFLWVYCKTFVKRYKAGPATIVEYRNLQVFEKCLNSCVSYSSLVLWRYLQCKL